MAERTSFADFLARLRAHDEKAAERLVQVYGPVILQTASRRLSRLGLSSVLEPADIAQQVFGTFFAKVAEEFELVSSDDLVQLLVTMTREQIIDEYRHAHAQRRGGEPHRTEDAQLDEIVAGGGEPNHQLIEEELLDQVHEQMSEEEWQVAKAWASGQQWDEVAAEFGQSAEALRKKLSRAIIRVKHDLNPE
jgi:RNA polymerase sigma factor (sigma-70 family)